MKNIYILTTEYTNGKSEINGVFATEDGAEKMQKFLIKTHLVGELEYKRGSIKTFEVEDDVNSITINDQEYLIV